MSSLTEVNYPQDRRSEHRNNKFINLACLFLTLLSTAVSVGTIVLFRTQQSCRQAAPVSITGTITGTDIPTRPEVATNNKSFQASSTGTVRPIVPPRSRIIQGLTGCTGQRLLWLDLNSSMYNVTESGNYLVYTQVTFRSDHCLKPLVLKLTLCHTLNEEGGERELLVTSASVCEYCNTTNWTRSLSQVVMVDLRVGDSLYVNSTSVEHVDFDQNTNNIFGIIRLEH